MFGFQQKPSSFAQQTLFRRPAKKCLYENFCHPGVSLNRISAIAAAQLMTPPLPPVHCMVGYRWVAQGMRLFSVRLMLARMEDKPGICPYFSWSRDSRFLNSHPHYLYL